MDCREAEGIVFVRMFKGEDFFRELERACERTAIVSAGVVSAVGMLSDFELGYFRGKGDYAKQLFRKPHEFVALSGIIIKEGNGYNFHLHAAFADEDKSLKGGHLFSARVAVTAEIILLKSKARLSRVLEEDTGLMGLRL